MTERISTTQKVSKHQANNAKATIITMMVSMDTAYAPSRVSLLLLTLLISPYFDLFAVKAAELVTPEDYLAAANDFLSNDETEQAISTYRQGLDEIGARTTPDTENNSLVTLLSLYTNLATAYSSQGEEGSAVELYKKAILAYQTKLADPGSADAITPSTQQEAALIVAQASFYLGIAYQDQDSAHDAVQAYVYAHRLDPLHWSAMANLGSVLHDQLANHEKALEAYNKAYNILINSDQEPTDAPSEPRFVLSQLQYRIGLCISHEAAQGRKCAVEHEQDSPKDCHELATHAFSLAVQYDPDNEAAKHMLATLTADATMERASNQYVKSLFDDYAKNFEHSLVQDLGYTGYERLRRGFDRAFGGRPPLFQLVVDAGCGTGLVGEQFRNVSERLVGVDLSEAIIQQALVARPHLYDETIAADVTEVFRSRHPISLIVAGDSFIYFGDLSALFDAISHGLNEGGKSECPII